MEKIIGSNPEQWVNLEAVTSARYEQDRGITPLVLVLGSDSARIADADQVKRIAQYLGIGDPPASSQP